MVVIPDVCGQNTVWPVSGWSDIVYTYTWSHAHMHEHTQTHTHTPAEAITAPWRKHLETGASLVISPWSRLHPKWHRIPYIVHYFWPGPIGHYIGNRVPFGTQTQTLNSRCYRTRKGTCVVCPPFSVFYSSIFYRVFTSVVKVSTIIHKHS
jgi:hypothetical protein